MSYGILQIEISEQGEWSSTEVKNNYQTPRSGVNDRLSPESAIDFCLVWENPCGGGRLALRFVPIIITQEVRPC